MVQQDRQNNIVSWIIFILLLGNGLVLANTDKHVFTLLGKTDYYLFNQYCFWSTIGLFIETIILGWYGWLSIIRNRYDIHITQKRMYILCLLGMIICLSINYTYLGKIWDSDPTHSLPFYNNFWSDGVIDFSSLQHNNVNNTTVLRGGNHTTNVSNKKWAYILADILVRVWSIIIMALPMLLLISILAIVSFWCVGKYS